MKKLLIPLSFCLCITAYGQVHHYQNTMYWNNVSWLNPAASGVEHNHYGVIFGRNQWMGIDGTPKMIGASYDAKLSGINSGIGVNYIYDKIGFEQNQITYVNYAYHLNLNDQNKLSFGLKGGLINKRIDASWITPNPYVIDPAIPTQSSENVFDFGAGVYYQGENLWFSASTTNLFEHEYDELNINTQRFFWFGGGYEYEISQNISLSPQFMVKTNFSGYMIDLNLLTTLYQDFWIGMNHRVNSKFFAFQAGVELFDHFGLGASYGINSEVFPDNKTIEGMLVAKF